MWALFMSTLHLKDRETLRVPSSLTEHGRTWRGCESRAAPTQVHRQEGSSSWRTWRWSSHSLTIHILLLTGGTAAPSNCSGWNMLVSSLVTGIIPPLTSSICCSPFLSLSSVLHQAGEANQPIKTPQVLIWGGHHTNRVVHVSALELNLKNIKFSFKSHYLSSRISNWWFIFHDTVSSWWTKVHLLR